MKAMKTRNLLSFLTEAQNFGWSYDKLIAQLASVCSVAIGGAENPKLEQDIRDSFVSMILDVSKETLNREYWDMSSLLNMIISMKNRGTCSRDIYVQIHNLCVASVSGRMGSGANSPIN